ncbi:MAG: hypothetical protein ACYDG6_12335 [Thermincolia bacterium]
MYEDVGRPKLRLLINNFSELEALHDNIRDKLESPAKKGIRQLLGLNNQSFKKALYPNFNLYGVRDEGGLMAAIDSLLNLHSKECYIIGYLDCIKKDELINRKVEDYNTTHNELS